MIALFQSLIWTLLAGVVTAVSYTPIQPPSYPLAVRNPYTSGQYMGSHTFPLSPSLCVLLLLFSHLNIVGLLS